MHAFESLSPTLAALGLHRAAAAPLPHARRGARLDTDIEHIAAVGGLTRADMEGACYGRWRAWESLWLTWAMGAG